MLGWLFGDIQINKVKNREKNTASGFLEFKKARVKWFLSTEKKHLPNKVAAGGQTTYRSIKIDGKELEFSSGFADLHTLLYKDIVNGKGYGLHEVRKAIEIVYNIRTANI